MARTKGSGGTKTLSSIPFSTLKKLCGEDTVVVVQTKWLKAQGIAHTPQEAPPEAQSPSNEMGAPSVVDAPSSVDIQEVNLEDF